MELLSSIKKEPYTNNREERFDPHRESILTQSFQPKELLTSQFSQPNPSSLNNQLMQSDQKYTPFTMKLYEETLKPARNKIQEFKPPTASKIGQLYNIQNPSIEPKRLDSHFRVASNGRGFSNLNLDLFGSNSLGGQNGYQSQRLVDDMILKTQISSHESGQNMQLNRFGSSSTVNNANTERPQINNNASVFYQDQKQGQQTSSINQKKTSPILTAKQKINKALIAARFTKTTRKIVKQNDIRKQIKTARELNYKPLTGLSKELNFLAKEMESVQYTTEQKLNVHHLTNHSSTHFINNNRINNQNQVETQGHNRVQSMIEIQKDSNKLPNRHNQQSNSNTLFKDYKQLGDNFYKNQGDNKSKIGNFSMEKYQENLSQGDIRKNIHQNINGSPGGHNRSLSDKLEEKNLRLKAQLIQTSLSNKLKIVNKFEKSDLNHSKFLKEKKQKYKSQVQQEEQRIKIAKERLKNSMEDYRKVHEERGKQQKEIMEQKQDFKETIIKSRSEYLRKKNELALNMAKERYEINNLLDSELKRSKNLTNQKTIKAKLLHDLHIKEIQQKAELKNKEIFQKTTLVFQNKVSETEEFKNKIVNDRSQKEIRKQEVIKQTLQNDPSLYMWMQKGASGSRLRESIGENMQADLENMKRRQIIRLQLQKDFGQENQNHHQKRSESQSNIKIVIKDEDNNNRGEGDDSHNRSGQIINIKGPGLVKSMSQQNSFIKKQPKKVRIKEPKSEHGERPSHFRTASSKMDMKRLERIVDTEKYDFTNMGYQWDIINGYMGGEKINKKMTYERALALTQESRLLPFEIRKKERLFNLGHCFKLEKDTSDKDFDNALRFLELRENNYNKEKALQLARKTTCRQVNHIDYSTIKSSLSRFGNLVTKGNDADIVDKTDNIQLEVMQNLIDLYAIKDQKIKDQLRSESPNSHSPSKKQNRSFRKHSRPLTEQNNTQNSSPLRQNNHLSSLKLKQQLSTQQLQIKQQQSSTKYTSPTKQHQIGQFILDKAKREDQQQKQQETMKNAIRVLARRSQSKAYKQYYEQIERESQKQPNRSQITSLDSINQEIEKSQSQRQLNGFTGVGSDIFRISSPRAESQSDHFKLLPIIEGNVQLAQTARVVIHQRGNMGPYMLPIREEIASVVEVLESSVIGSVQNLSLNASIPIQPSQLEGKKISALDRLKKNKADKENRKKLQNSIDKNNRERSQQLLNRINTRLYRAQTTNNGSPNEGSAASVQRRKKAAITDEIPSMHRKTGSAGFNTGVPVSQLQNGKNSSQVIQPAYLIPIIPHHPAHKIKKGKYTEEQLFNLERIKQKHLQGDQLKSQMLEERRRKASDIGDKTTRFDYIQRQIEQKSMQKMMAQENKQKMIADHLQQIRSLQKESHKQKTNEQEERRKRAYDQMLQKTIEDSELKQQKLGKKLQKISNLELNKDFLQMEQRKLVQSLGLGLQKIMIKKKKEREAQHTGFINGLNGGQEMERGSNSGEFLEDYDEYEMNEEGQVELNEENNFLD